MPPIPNKGEGNHEIVLLLRDEAAEVIRLVLMLMATWP